MCSSLPMPICKRSRYSFATSLLSPSACENSVFASQAHPPEKAMAPPTISRFSTRITLKPACAAAKAASWPVPPPTTTTSASSSHASEDASFEEQPASAPSPTAPPARAAAPAMKFLRVSSMTIPLSLHCAPLWRARLRTALRLRRCSDAVRRRPLVAVWRFFARWVKFEID